MLWQALLTCDSSALSPSSASSPFSTNRAFLHHLQTVIAMRERKIIMGLASQLILFAFQANRKFALVLGLSGSVVSSFSLAI